MDILALTSSEAVRATVGVATSELEDQVFTDRGIADELELDLSSWLPNWKSLKDDTSGDATIEQQQLALKVYAKYFCCVLIFASANMQFLQRKSDGDVESHRYDEKNLEQQREELKRLMQVAKGTLLELETLYTDELKVNEHTHFLRASRSRDIITE